MIRGIEILSSPGTVNTNSSPLGTRAKIGQVSHLLPLSLVLTLSLSTALCNWKYRWMGQKEKADVQQWGFEDQTDNTSKRKLKNRKRKKKVILPSVLRSPTE